MENKTPLESLRESIFLLEKKQAEHASLLKDQFKITSESLKPINLIKNSIKDFVESSEIKEDLLKTALSIAAGYVSKKLIIGSSQNSFKNMAGSLLQLLITSIVSKNSDEIKSVVANAFNSLINTDESPETT